MAEITIGVSGRGNGKECAICKMIAEVANKLGATKESPLRVAVQRNEVQKENLEKLFQQMGVDNIAVEFITPKEHKPLIVPLPPLGSELKKEPPCVFFGKGNFGNKKRDKKRTFP